MSRTAWQLAITLCLAGLALPAGAVPVADVPLAEPALLGEVPMGALNSLAYAGGHAYAGLGPRVLAIDVADPGQPRQTAFTAALAAPIRDLDVADGHLFVAAGVAGLHVFSLAQPGAPRHVGELPGTFSAVVAGGGYAYAAGGATGGVMVVVDVRTPDRPRPLAWVEAAGGRMALHGNLLHVALGAMGLAIYDVAAPASPRRLGGHDSPGTALDVAVSTDGGRAVVADKTALRVLDVSDPASPREIGSYTPAQDQQCYPYVSPEDCRTVERVRLSGSQAFVLLHRCDDAFSCRAAGGLRVVDIAEPAAPREVASHSARGNPAALALGAGQVYLAERATWWYGGIAPCMLAEGFLQILSESAEPVSALTPMASAASLHLTPGRAWLADPIADLGVLDVTDPSAPRPTTPDRSVRYLGTGYGQAAATDVYVTAGAAVVTIGPGYGAGWTLVAADGAPAARPLNGCAPPPPSQWYTRVVANDTYAYVLDATGALQTLDVVTGRPVLAAQWPVGTGSNPAQALGAGQGLDLAGDRLYVAHSDGLAILDLTDPAHPRALGQLGLAGGLTGVAVLGQVAYIGAGDGGVWVVDVRNPAAPAQLGRLEVSGPVADVAVAGSRLYVAAGSAGLVLFDVSQPARPVAAESIATLYGARRVAVTDGLVGVLADGGLFLLAGERLPTPTPGTPTPASATPTPTDAATPAPPVLLPYASKG